MHEYCVREVATSDSNSVEQTLDFTHAKSMIESIKFNTLNYSPEILERVCEEMFFRFQLDLGLNIRRSSITVFISDVRRKMFDNPYHNWFHVVDVTQTVFYFARKSGMLNCMTTKERLALFLAAVCHDLEHPGVSNQFFVSHAAKHSNGKSTVCLEQHHSSKACQLLSNFVGSGLLDGLAQGDRQEVMQGVHRLILATDMSRHTDYCKRLEALIQARSAAECTGQNPLSFSPEDKQLVFELLLKGADVSNVVKPYITARAWAVSFAPTVPSIYIMVLLLLPLAFLS
mmetsp:Transcript_55501/g.146348  ORF Transcript_55501/g.146348 Transcript_55501/m.146348 type:complete len:286 (-) Transcript_55501:744-1601(-)